MSMSKFVSNCQISKYVEGQCPASICLSDSTPLILLPSTFSCGLWNEMSRMMRSKKLYVEFRLNFSPCFFRVPNFTPAQTYGAIPPTISPNYGQQPWGDPEMPPGGFNSMNLPSGDQNSTYTPTAFSNQHPSNTHTFTRVCLRYYYFH